MDEKNNEKDKRKQKTVYIDDGRSVADMSRIGRFGHVYSDAQLANRARKKLAKEQKEQLALSKEERRAAFRGGLRAAVPAFLMLLAVCGLLFLIVFLWFRP